MKHLVIAEKPSVARDIARVLGCTKKTNAYMEGAEYIVTWALGHLVTLADPEEYGKQYQKWELDTLPDRAERMEGCGDPPDNRSVQGCAGADLQKRCIGHYHCNGCRPGR